MVKLLSSQLTDQRSKPHSAYFILDSSYANNMVQSRVTKTILDKKATRCSNKTFQKYNIRKENHIGAYQVKIYDACSFRKTTRVCPPIGPPTVLDSKKYMDIKNYSNLSF